MLLTPARNKNFSLNRNFETKENFNSFREREREWKKDFIKEFFISSSYIWMNWTIADNKSNTERKKITSKNDKKKKKRDG